MKRPTIALNRSVTLFFAVATAGLLAGCSDPSKDVHKSDASAPQETAAAPSPAAKTYVVRAESKIDFIGSKVTGSHNGGFKKFSGNISVADGKIVTPTEIKIDLNSTWSDNGKLTDHLKSEHFFEVAKYPMSTFTVTSIEPGEGGKQKVTGNLDLHGVSKSISFPADIQITDQAVTVKADFAINRREFNINYAGKANDLIRDNVVLKLDIQATPGEPRPEDKLMSQAQ